MADAARRLALPFHVFRFTVLDDDAAARYLARHPELRGQAARRMLDDNLARAARHGNKPSIVRLHARVAMLDAVEPDAASDALPPLDAGEISRRHEAAVARLRTGDPREMGSAIGELEALLADPRFGAAPAAVRLPVVSDTGTAWLQRFELTGDAADLRHARAHLEYAAVLADTRPADQGLILANLAIIANREFDFTGNGEHLRRGIELLRRAAAAEPEGSEGRAFNLVNLATALLAHFTATLRGEQLDEAIATFREAGAMMQTVPVDAMMAYLRGLGSALLTRYRVVGQLADVDDAIEALSVTLFIPGLTAVDHSLAMTVLGHGMLQRAVAAGAPDWAVSAVGVLESAVTLAPENPLMRASALVGLGRAHRVAYDLSGDVASLDEAVRQLGEAALLAPPNSGLRIRALSDVGEALTTRYHAAVRHSVAAPIATGDLEAAVKALKMAAKPVRTPEIAGRLAAALSAHAEVTGSHFDRGQARALFEQACRDGLPEVSLPAGAAWGEWALRRERWPEAERAFGYAIGASDRLFAIQVTRAHKEGALRPVRGLAAGRAYAAARAGDPARAVEILEQGRTRLVAEVLRLGEHAVRGLQARTPELARRFRDAAISFSAAAALEDGTLLAPASPGRSPDVLGTAADRALRARAELDAVMDEIRREPGFEAFAAPLSLREIAAAAGPAPLVYLAVTPVGGLALLVESDQRVTPVWLPRLDTATVRAQLDGRYAGAYRAWRSDREEATKWERVTEWENVLDATLRWAWDAAVGPLLGALAARGHAGAVLIVPGLLQLLPLHAAWTEDPARPGGRRFASDDALLTCAPSARLLAATRAPRPARGSTLLLVDNPDGSLGGADAGWILSSGGFDPDASCVLAGAAATHDATLEALPRGDTIHFTSHGVADAREPLRSGVMLADEWLELEEILELRLERGPLVFLSACETTLPGTELPDEVVSLPTAFLQAGASGVLGSLWPVDDKEAAMLEAAFYEHLGHGEPPARALHLACAELRANDPDPAGWAAFTYTGARG